MLPVLRTLQEREMKRDFQSIVRWPEPSASGSLSAPRGTTDHGAFGIQQLHEDGALRGVRTPAEMQEALASLMASLGLY
jgi:hypothetical protein